MSDLFTRLAEHAASLSERIALEGGTTQLTYRELYEAVEALAAQFKSLSVTNIGLFSDNDPHWVVVQLAALKAAIPVTPIPLFFSDEQILHLITAGGVDLVFCRDGLAARLPESVKWQPVSLRQEGEWYQRADGAERASDSGVLAGTALVTFTSGTTGQARGVCIGADLLDSVCAALDEVTAPLEISRHLCLLPLPVMLENVAGVMLPLRAGATVCLPPSSRTGLSGSSGLDAATLAKCLNELRPESLILTPELLKVLVCLASQGLTSDSLKFVAVGGGRTAPALLQQAQALGIPVYEGYGLSECGSVVSLNHPAAHRIGSAGRPLSHCQVQIAPSGEVRVSGPRMLGYLGEPVSAEEAVNTGDLGHIDEDGYLHITGRRKNVQINSFGRNLSPEWIESEINMLPGVLASAVFGDQRPSVAAVISTLKGAEWDVVLCALAALNQRLPDYARILAPIRAVAPFSPSNRQLTPNGRIRRDAIYAAYLAQIERSIESEFCSHATEVKGTDELLSTLDS